MEIELILHTNQYANGQWEKRALPKVTFNFSSEYFNISDIFFREDAGRFVDEKNHSSVFEILTVR